MADLKKVSSGEKLKIPASTYNVFIDTAQDYLKRQNRQTGGDAGTPLQSKFVLIKNTTASAVNRFGVLGISNTELLVSENYFKQNIILTGIAPSSTSHSSGRFVIVHEPIAAGGVGRAYINGHCQVQINVTDANHTFCDVKNSDSTMLQSAESGPAVIIWKESGTGTKWAIIRFGGSGGGSPFTTYEIAKTPDMVTLSTYYKLRPLGTSAWTARVYAVGDLVKKMVSSVEKTYRCILAHTGVAGTNDPENGSWATYWQESYLNGYIFAPPYGNNIEEFAPILQKGESVLTMYDGTYIWIIAPGFIHIATTSGGVLVEASLKWNLTQRRLMSVFGG